MVPIDRLSALSARTSSVSQADFQCSPMLSRSDTLELRTPLDRRVAAADGGTSAAQLMIHLARAGPVGTRSGLVLCACGHQLAQLVQLASSASWLLLLLLLARSSRLGTQSMASGELHSACKCNRCK